ALWTRGGLSGSGGGFDGNRGPGAADRVRECGKPAAGARIGTQQGACRAYRDWRQPPPLAAATSDREPAFGAAWRNVRRVARDLGRPGAGPGFWNRHFTAAVTRSAVARLLLRRDACHRVALWADAGAPHAGRSRLPDT